MKNTTYISAGAGSGKTYTLTEKMAELIANGEVKPSEIILTTFTNRAADEFKEKAKDKLFSKGLFREATAIDQALVGTVHSVANAIVNRYWFKLGLPPHMGVMAEADQDLYISQSLATIPTSEELEILQGFAREFEITEGFRDGKPSSKIDEDIWKKHLDAIIRYSTNYEISDFTRSKQESLDFIRQFVNPAVKIDFTQAEIDALFKECRDAFDRQKDSDANTKRKDKLKQLSRGKRRPTIGWYRELSGFLNDSKFPKSCKGPLVLDFADRLVPMWHSQLVYDKEAKYITTLFELAGRWQKEYAEFKRNRRMLDYDDMEKYMLQLISREDIADDIRRTYRYLFVDEFQDCSPIQLKIFNRLSELMHHSYWVGDYKQSIYGFRGSDIPLIKEVVDEIDLGNDGCATETLGTSYRSLPEIVGVCNNVFTQTFADVLSRDKIQLQVCEKKEKERKEKGKGFKSLQYWDFTYASKDEGAGYIADQIGYLINVFNENPSDIAVLARTNPELVKVAAVLTDLGIPCSRQDLSAKSLRVFQLLTSLLQLVVSTSDALAKATVAHLTEKDFTIEELIDSRLDFVGEPSTFLNEIPLVKKLLTKREQLRQQSVSAMVESMVHELGLYEEVKHWNAAALNKVALDTLIQASKAYEAHCLQMGLPATISGLIAYFNDDNNDLPLPGNREGVQLHTYHKSKGLQWKRVILCSLDENPADKVKCVSRNIFGVHFVRTDNPDTCIRESEVYIRVVPFIYGASNSTKIWADIEAQIEQTADFERVFKDNLAEANRLMYVGMTRAADVLTLAVLKPGRGKHCLQWFEDMELTNVSTAFEDNKVDCFSTGDTFCNTDYTPDEEAGETSEYDNPLYEYDNKTIELPHGNHCCDVRDLSPSNCKGKASHVAAIEIGERIPLTGSHIDMAEVGNCIHQIMCAIETAGNKLAYAEGLVKSYGLSNVLSKPDKILSAWQNLTEWMGKTYGNATRVHHERPFKHIHEGHVYTGSMDLVWETPEGFVLLDFKTCPMGKDAILDPNSKHYAGLYAGQLDAYQNALEAAGEKVLARYIYYPVSGLLVEIGTSEPGDDPTKEDTTPKDTMKEEDSTIDFTAEGSTLHVFGIEGLDIDRFWNVAAKYCSDDGFSGHITMFIPEDSEKEEDVDYFDTKLDGASTQGVSVTYFSGEKPHIHFELPPFGSIGDVKLVFGYLKALREMCPECGIFFNDSYKEDGQFVVNDENYDALVVQGLRNMMSLIEHSTKEQHMGCPGIYHEFIVPSQEDYPNMLLEDLTMKAMNDFISLQWEYQDYENAGGGHAVSPAGEEFTFRILANSKDVFVPICEHVIVKGAEAKVENIPTQDFIAGMKDNPHFKMVDQMQFVLDKMPAEEWEKVYQKFKSYELGNAEAAKEFVPEEPEDYIEEDISTEDMEEPTDENSLTLKVPARLFDEMLGGKEFFELDVTNETYQSILETIEGNIILNTEEMPTRFYGCHFWNKGEFPYFIKKGLKYIRLINQTRMITAMITGHAESVKERCDFKQDGTCKPNPSGDACIWTVRFDIEHYSYGGIPKKEDPEREPNFFLLRWNPAISSMTLERYQKEMVEHWDATNDWSIYEWKEAHAGDIYFMIREGDDKHAGIVFRGIFESDPFVSDDWAGTSRQRRYCIISAFEQPSQVDGLPYISMQELEEKLPDIDWRKGHSGERITKEQAEILFELWDPTKGAREKEPGDANTPFDPDQGHGAHLQCIDDDVKEVITSVCDSLDRMKDVVGTPEIEANDEDGEAYDTRLLILSANENKEMTVRCIIEEQEDSNELKSFFPYVTNKVGIPMKLIKIDEYSNGFEAVVTAEYDGQEFGFFDVDYALHKDEYEIGKTYNFALSAIAYNAEIVPEKDMHFEITPENVENIYRDHPDAMERDADGNILPMKMSCEQLVMCMQTDGKYPDDAEFWSPVESRGKKVSLLKHEFYCFDICIHHDEDEEYVLNIPLAARTSFFKEKPTMKNSVRGHLWLQGRLIDENKETKITLSDD